MSWWARKFIKECNNAVVFFEAILADDPICFADNEI